MHLFSTNWSVIARGPKFLEPVESGENKEGNETGVKARGLLGISGGVGNYY